MTTHALAHDHWDWNRVHRLCLREARRVLGPDHRVEDAAQEAAMRAWVSRHRCQEPGRPDAWIATIARREALRIVVAPVEAPVLEDDQPPHPGFAEDAERRIDVKRALAGLPPEDRALLVARYWHDMTQAAAARSLGIPDGTGKVRLHRLRRHLAHTLGA